MATKSTIRTSASKTLLNLCFLLALDVHVRFTVLATTRDATRHTNLLGDPNPSCDHAVYPYWSLWFLPAFYDYEGGRYKLGSTTTSLQLSPEWDETNSTYYVRLSENGATYAFSHITRALRPFLSPSHDDVLIYNVDTGRYLSLRDEGGESFLIESNYNDGERTVFQFSVVNDLRLPCPRILGACCLGYNILSERSDYGLGPYIEDGITYFKLQYSGDDNLLPFLLLDDSRSSASSSHYFH